MTNKQQSLKDWKKGGNKSGVPQAMKNVTRKSEKISYKHEKSKESTTKGFHLQNEMIKMTHREQKVKFSIGQLLLILKVINSNTKF